MEIKMQGENTAEILIYETIGHGWDGGISAKDFAEQLRDLGDGIETIHLRINSMGGSVFEGMAIYSLLAAHGAKIIAYVDGIAASMASVIAMVGEDIVMSENAVMMIHKPWTVTMGDSDDHAKSIELLDKLENQGVGIYSSKTGIEEGKIRQMLKDETWLNAAEALEMGFATQVGEAVDAAALVIDRDLYPNAPKQLRHVASNGKDVDQIKQAKAEREAEAEYIRVRRRLVEVGT